MHVSTDTPPPSRPFAATTHTCTHACGFACRIPYITACFQADTPTNNNNWVCQPSMLCARADHAPCLRCLYQHQLASSLSPCAVSRMVKCAFPFAEEGSPFQHALLAWRSTHAHLRACPCAIHVCHCTCKAVTCVHPFALRRWTHLRMHMCMYALYIKACHGREGVKHTCPPWHAARLPCYASEPSCTFGCGAEPFVRCA